MRARGIAISLGALILIGAAVACGDGDSTAPASALEMAAQAPVETADARATSGSGLSGSGIWVAGTASVPVEPDLVMLTIGVEAMGESVAVARSEAAAAMDAIVGALELRGIGEKDIRTQSINIWPQYEYPEVVSGETRTRTQVLVGYTVNNSATIKVRDLEAVGDIIDEVAAAGGDATRISGISFSIEDPAPFMSQLREDAVNDALSRARHLATLAGVEVGDLIFISEASLAAPAGALARAGAMEAMLAFDQATYVSGGELELSMSIQAAFSIR